MSITFTPTATGTRTGAVTITDDAPGSPHVVSLSGTGTEPSVALQPGSLSFVGQRVGTTSASQTVTLTNTGGASLTVASIVASGNFAQTNTCGGSLGAGVTCTLSITFTPTATGTRTGAVTITDDAAGSPHAVSLTGTGTAPAVSLSRTTVTFANQKVGTTSAAQTVTLSNTGSAPLAISSIVANGDFLQTSTCGSGVAAGAACSISVRFRPTATGTRTGRSRSRTTPPAVPTRSPFPEPVERTERTGEQVMSNRSGSRIWRAALPLALVATVSSPAAVSAGPSPHMRSGLVGIARLQTARLSAVRYAPARGEVEPVAVACRATLAFDHANGTPYIDRAGSPVRREALLMPDGTAFLDLRSADVFIDNPNLREPFRASVRFECPTSPMSRPTLGDLPAGPCEDVVVTLEVFETLTGRTSVFLSHPDFIDNPDLAPAPTRAVP